MLVAFHVVLCFFSTEVERRKSREREREKERKREREGGRIRTRRHTSTQARMRTNSRSETIPFITRALAKSISCFIRSVQNLNGSEVG